MKLKPKKSLSQNFLKNKEILNILANSLPDIHNEVVVEIGGGLGNLTQFLVLAKQLIVYEIDNVLSKKLKDKFKDYQNIKIINSDFLKANLKKFNHKYYLIGNIPYFITGKILRKIFNINNYPKIAVITFQKEYAQKILGKDGNNFLYSWIKTFSSVKKIVEIKKNNFFPAPKVDSLALKFEFYSQPLIKELKKFENFLKTLFKFNKRTILNNLKLKYSNKIINKLESNLLAKRPHQLTFDETLELFNILKNNEKNNKKV